MIETVVFIAIHQISEPYLPSNVCPKNGQFDYFNRFDHDSVLFDVLIESE